MGHAELPGITKKVHNYEFESASQLIEDFWKAVEEILK